MKLSEPMKEGYRSALEITDVWTEEFIHSYFRHIIKGEMLDYSESLLHYIVNFHCPKHGIEVPDIIKVIVEMATDE